MPRVFSPVLRQDNHRSLPAMGPELINGRCGAGTKKKSRKTKKRKKEKSGADCKSIRERAGKDGLEPEAPQNSKYTLILNFDIIIRSSTFVLCAYRLANAVDRVHLRALISLSSSPLIE